MSLAWITIIAEIAVVASEIAPETVEVEAHIEAGKIFTFLVPPVS